MELVRQETRLEWYNERIKFYDEKYDKTTEISVITTQY